MRRTAAGNAAPAVKRQQNESAPGMVRAIEVPGMGQPMSRDSRPKRDTHALNADGMVLCNPRDREAAHRAEMEGIATTDRTAVTCRKCLGLLYGLDKARRERRHDHER
jgi:hypothetical protein